MAGAYFIFAMLALIGFVYIVGVVIRASGLAKFVVYLEFHGDNKTSKQLRK